MIESSKKYPNKIEVAHHLRLTNNSSGPFATCESNDYVIHFYANDQESLDGFVREVVESAPQVPIINKITNKEIKRDGMGGYVVDLKYSSTIYFN